MLKNNYPLLGEAFNLDSINYQLLIINWSLSTDRELITNYNYV
ncbi:hypothetical protein [Dapis sp. BLCC M172]